MKSQVQALKAEVVRLKAREQALEQTIKGLQKRGRSNLGR